MILKKLRNCKFCFYIYASLLIIFGGFIIGLFSGNQFVCNCWQWQNLEVFFSGIFGALVSAAVTYIVASRQLALSTKHFEHQSRERSLQQLAAAKSLLRVISQKVLSLDSHGVRNSSTAMEYKEIVEASNEARPFVYATANVEIIEKFEALKSKTALIKQPLDSQEAGTFQRKVESAKEEARRLIQERVENG